MFEIDKSAMGRRIKQIRLRAGLKQWELARMLGTTQSAVHKYEHGVVPEPRRLLSLARAGRTSVEWILTGTHWENGSEDLERPTSDLLDTACLLRRLEVEERASAEEALHVLQEAVAALRGNGDDPPAADATALTEHAPEILHLLESALRIQRALVGRLLREAEGRLQESPLHARSGDSPPVDAAR